MKVEDNNYIFESNAEYSASKDFTTLECWKKCRKVRDFFYTKVLPKLPKEEKFNLDIQIRKSAVSSTANIAEGYGRYHFQEGVQFYRISRGSLYELKDHLITCNDLNYIESNLFKEGINLIEDAKKVLNGFIIFVKHQIKKDN